MRESVANELVSAQGILVEYLQCEHEQVEDQKGKQEIYDFIENQKSNQEIKDWQTCTHIFGHRQQNKTETSALINFLTCNHTFGQLDKIFHNPDIKEILHSNVLTCTHTLGHKQQTKTSAMVDFLTCTQTLGQPWRPRVAK